jgi:hypothetical protein
MLVFVIVARVHILSPLVCRPARGPCQGGHVIWRKLTRARREMAQIYILVIVFVCVCMNVCMHACVHASIDVCVCVFGFFVLAVGSSARPHLWEDLLNSP